MIIITNRNFHSAINICGKLIGPQKSQTFDKVDLDKINYYVSTGDIKVKYVDAPEKKTRQVSRKQPKNDTIIIGSGNEVNTSSDDTDEVKSEDENN